MKPFREELCDSLRRLASPAPRQIQYLRDLGVFPSADELALEFHELVLLADSKLRAVEITQRERDALAALDGKLHAFSGPEHAPLWTVDGLSSAPEWEEIRELAQESLALLRSGPQRAG